MNFGCKMQGLLLGLVVCALLLLNPVQVRAGEIAEETEDYPGFTEDFMSELNLQEIQELMDDMMGADSVSVKQLLLDLINGRQIFSKEQFGDVVYQAVIGGLLQQRKILAEVLLLVLAAAFFHCFSEAFERTQLGEISFYVVFMILFVLLVNAFGSLSRDVTGQLSHIVAFMKVIAPAYYLAVAAATGVSTATLFYELVLLLVLGIEILAVNILLPCINLYVLLALVNHLSKEDMLSKLADLLRMLVEWALRTMVGVLVGMQVVQGLVAPVIDSLRRTTIGKTAGAIPGVGNAINSVTEIMLTSAVLVKNSLGVVFLLVFVFWALTPLTRYALTGFLYKLLAALIQPVSDRRMMGCINTFGDGCLLLMKTLFAVQILCMVTFVIIAGIG